MPSTTHFHNVNWFSRCGVAVVAMLAMGWQIAGAAEPKRELWDLVHKDAGLAIEARNLSEQSRQFVKSELFQRIQRHSAWQQLLHGRQVQHLQQVRQAVNDVTHASLVSWLDKLFGQEVILAITPQASGKPRSVLLTRLKQPADLEEILAAWNKLEPRTEAKFQHRGVDYFSRVKADQHDPLFYVLIDDVLVVSDQGEAITVALDLALDQQHENALLRLPSFQKLLQTLNSASVIRIVAQPSAWRVSHSAAEAKPNDPVERWVKQAIDDCQIIGLGVRFDSGLLAEVVAMSDSLQRSPEWLKVVEKTTGTPGFLKRVPQSAVALVAGRQDVGDLASWILSNLSDEQSKKFKNVRQVLRGILLGNDLFDDVLPQMPADFGGYLVPRPEWQATSIPVDGLIAMTMPRTERTEESGRQRPGIRQAIDSAVTTGVSLVLAAQNGTATLEQSDFNGTIIHWIQNLGPVQPAYAMTTDYFLAASSPQLIRDFLSQNPAGTLAMDEKFQKANAELFGELSQIALLRGERVREFLAQHREFLLKQLEAAHKLKPEEASKRLDRMLEWVQLADQLVLGSSLHTDHIKVVLALNVTAP